MDAYLVLKHHFTFYGGTRSWDTPVSEEEVLAQWYANRDAHETLKAMASWLARTY
jgi:hypothetical protein